MNFRSKKFTKWIERAQCDKWAIILFCYTYILLLESCFYGGKERILITLRSMIFKKKNLAKVIFAGILKCRRRINLTDKTIIFLDAHTI
jgi:hypothetical protein